MPSLRRTIERLARGRTFWRRLPVPFGAARMLVTPDAALSYLRPGAAWCDPELLAVVDRHVRPGDVVWDVGANVGVFAAAAAVRAGSGGQVVCVEPDLTLSALIRRTAAALPAAAAPTDVLVAAIADEARVATFLIAERGRASNALAEHADRTQAGGVRERQLVPVLTLDHLLAATGRPPGMVKVDVEGAEAAVLRGGRTVLHDARPTLYVEVGAEHVDACTSLLADARYVLFAPTGDGPRVDRCVWNTLAIPAERAP